MFAFITNSIEAVNFLFIDILKNNSIRFALFGWPHLTKTQVKRAKAL